MHQEIGSDINYGEVLSKGTEKWVRKIGILSVTSTPTEQNFELSVLLSTNQNRVISLNLF